MTAQPRVSIVTVNFNMAEEVAGTLDSVLAQELFQYQIRVVIDGASTDGGARLLRVTGRA